MSVLRRLEIGLVLVLAGCAGSRVPVATGADPAGPDPSDAATTETAAKTPTRPSGPEHFAGAIILSPDGKTVVEWFTRVDAEAGTASLWVPEQGLLDLPVTSFEVEDDGTYVLAWAPLGATLTIDASEEACVFEQGGQPPCEMEAITAEAFAEYAEPERPQHPEPPFPYAQRDIEVVHPTESGIKLAGTLTIPKGEGPFPTAVLVSGSGPQDRDETLMGHKPFLVIADHLTRAGVAVFRYDDRGFGKSTGKTGAVLDQSTSDALAVVEAIREQPEVDPDRVGIVGHSEGGLIAPKIAAAHPELIDYIVLLAGPGVLGRELYARQLAQLEHSQDAKTDPVADEKLYRATIDAVLDLPRDEALPKVKAMFEKAGKPEMMLDAVLNSVALPWLESFLQYDPRPDLAKVKCPTLALIGTTDLQVDDEQNIPALEKALKKAPTKVVRVEAREGLNHLFQHSETGATEEYATITETFDPETLELISAWILEQTTGR